MSVSLCSVFNLRTQKLSDINQDNVLKSTDVVCLTETWLKQISGNSIGGELIAITDTVQVTNVCHFSFTNVLIEASSITLSLPSCKDLIVTMVYRSPSVPISAFLSAMSDVIESLITGMPN